MSYYSIETWTIRNVAKAFNFKVTQTDVTDLKVVIPIFQRGLRWDSKRRKDFIDSLEKGYPFGSLLFAKQDGVNKYSVVDGLQRGSTVCDYVYNPLGKDNIVSIDNSVLDTIRLALFPGNTNTTINHLIEVEILSYFHEQKQFDKVQMLTLAGKLMDKFATGQDKFTLALSIQNAIQPYFDSCKDKYNAICDSPVPIVVYSGPQELLNEIFNRINTKGIPLNEYEIYSATWSQHKFEITDTTVVENVIKKYWALSDAGYEIDGFDATAMRTSKKLTAFEFLFGLGKLWGEKFDCLKLSDPKTNDSVNELSFEIIDACLNNNKSISTLDKRLKPLNVNLLKRRIEEAISFVQNSIAVVSSFKGNKRKYNVLHSKYQIVCLISYTFREMYSPDNLNSKRAEWTASRQKEFASLLLSHYVSDIISYEWHDGGGSKVYTSIKDKRFNEQISERRWESLLENYYQNQLQAKQRDRFNNPVNADSVILNCIYVNLFTAADHLSSKKYDIEHLATKERMRSIMKKFNDLKLPVSCIANFCYLPEDINRGKKEKTIYEATGLSMTISEIESKFSFTQKEDFDWISYPYGAEDLDKLKTDYQIYLDNRFEEMKNRFIKLFYPDYSGSSSN